MLARSSRIDHPLGIQIDLPRLVPAFSSKGFPFLSARRRKQKAGTRRGRVRSISETTLALELVFLAFDILGITEKELGKDLMDRLKSLAKLRLAMDREGVTIPIHVWGGLDPISTPLYFFSGAEIFDGISWLRYAFVEGVAVYRDSYSILTKEIETPQDQTRALAISHNLAVMRKLCTNFRDSVLNRGSSFLMFESRATVFESAYRALAAQIPAIDGGQ